MNKLTGCRNILYTLACVCFLISSALEIYAMQYSFAAGFFVLALAMMTLVCKSKNKEDS